MQDVDDNYWYPMQHDQVVAQDTAAALEGLDLADAAPQSPGMARAMSSDLEAVQEQQDHDLAEQKGPQLLEHAQNQLHSYCYTVNLTKRFPC